MEYLHVMTGLDDRARSVVVCRAVETNGALLFVPLVEMEKVFRSYVQVLHAIL